MSLNIFRRKPVGIQQNTVLRILSRDIRDFARQRLADFKVPRKLVFLKEIPKGATGKLQRIGLAEKLGLGKAGLGK